MSIITASVDMCLPPDEQSEKKKLFFILQTDGELEKRDLLARYALSAPLKVLKRARTQPARLGVTIDSSRWDKLDMTVTTMS